MADWTKTRFNLRYHWATITLRIVSLVAAPPPGLHGEVEYMPIRTLASRIVVVACLILGIGVSQGDAWVQQYRSFPDGEATVVLHRFQTYCQVPRYCDEPTDGQWRRMIEDAAQAWNDAGSGFRFYMRAPRADDDPCSNMPGHIFVILSTAEDDDVCPGDPPVNRDGRVYNGRARSGRGWARIYINARVYGGRLQYGLNLLPRVLLHELGHPMGLGHPNQHGQDVESIMNTYQDLPAALQADDIAGVQALYGVRLEPERLIGFLENPGDGSFRSGIGVISGWVCDAETVEISIWPPHGGRASIETAAYGTDRADTAYTKDGEKICGDTNNGFGLLFNWNRLEEEEYVVDVLVDGELLDRATVYLTNLGQEFLRGVSGRYVLEDFPYPGESVVVEWEEGLQNFVIVERR